MPAYEFQQAQFLSDFLQKSRSMHSSMQSIIRRKPVGISTLQSDEYELIPTSRDADALQLPGSSQMSSDRTADGAYTLAEAPLYSGEELIWIQRRVDTSILSEPLKLNDRESQEPLAGTAVLCSQNDSDYLHACARTSQLPESEEPSIAAPEYEETRADASPMRTHKNFKSASSTRFVISR